MKQIKQLLLTVIVTSLMALTLHTKDVIQHLTPEPLTATVNHPAEVKMMERYGTNWHALIYSTNAIGRKQMVNDYYALANLTAKQP